MRSRVVGGWLLAAGLVTTAVVGACADPKGAIMLAINTDMKAPKDVNAVSVTISTNGAIKHSFIGRVTPQGEVLLPATLAIVEPEDKGASIRVRVMAFQDRKPRVLRDVRTTIPQNGRTALLRIPLNFVNDGMVVGAPLPPQNVLPDPAPGTGGFTPAGGTGSGSSDGGPEGGASDPGIGGSPTSAADFDFMGAFQPPCDDIQNQTIIDGECKDNFIDPETLPDFEGTPIGDSTDQGTCFDLAKCFATATGVGSGEGNAPADAGTGTSDPPSHDSGSGSGGDFDAGGGKFKSFGAGLQAVSLDKATCALQLNGAAAATLNIALVTPDTGECVRPGECYVPIDRGGAGGWKEENGRVQLPTFVCKLLTGKNLRLATSTAVCPAKEEANPICTPKPGDPVPAPMDGGDQNGSTVRIVPEDFPSATIAIGSALFFAAASRVGFVNVLAPNAPAVPISGIALDGTHLPWRFSNPFNGPIALANGTGDGYVLTGGEGPNPAATKVTIAPGTFDVTGLRGSAPLLWAVRSGDQSSFWTSDLQGAAAKSPLTPNFLVTAVTSNGTDGAIVVGDMGGNVRVCSVPETCHPPAPTPAGGRVDALAARMDQKGGYILSAGGISRVNIQSQTVVQLTPLLAADLGGVTEGSAYFARGLATNDRCVFYTSKEGLSFVNDTGGPGQAPRILVPAGTRQFLGLSLGPSATGPAGAVSSSAVYYTVYGAKEQEGGVWRVSMPAECLGTSTETPDAGPADSGGDGGAQLMCNMQTCPTGCCQANICRSGTTITTCGNNGAQCMNCETMGLQCDPGMRICFAP